MGATMRVISLVVIFALTGSQIVRHNRLTFSRGIRSSSVLRVVMITLSRAVVILLLMLPAIAVKSGIDYGVYRALDSIDARIAMVKGVSVPTLRSDKYPIYSPLRWAGIPRVRVVQSQVSLQNEVATSRFLLYGIKWILFSISVAANLLLLVLFMRSIASIFCRELVAHGLGVTFYFPSSLPASVESPDINFRPRGKA